MKNEVKPVLKIRSDRDFTESMNFWCVKEDSGNEKYKMMNGE